MDIIKKGSNKREAHRVDKSQLRGIQDNKRGTIAMLQLIRRHHWVTVLAAIQTAVITVGVVLIMSTTQENTRKYVGPINDRSINNTRWFPDKHIQYPYTLQENMSNGDMQDEPKNNDNPSNREYYNADDGNDYMKNKHKNYNENNRYGRKNYKENNGNNRKNYNENNGNTRQSYNENSGKDFVVNNPENHNENNRKDHNLDSHEDHSKNNRKEYNANNCKDSSASSYREDIRGSIHDLNWSPEMDVLEEKIVMSDAPLKDLREMADVHKSVFNIIDPKPSYSTGDEVKIFIELYDGFGRRRQTGGDRLMVRMFEQPLEASAIGYMLDHDNGTYTAIVKCLWKGNPKISIALDFPRQVIRLLYEQLYKNVKTLYIYYKNNERQSCQPTVQYLDATKTICNMADYNGGMSWFCQAPEGNGTSCLDVKIFRGGYLNDQIDGELKGSLMERNRTFSPTFEIAVQGNESFTQAADRKLPCYLYNKAHLWFLPSPVGYFMHNEWNIVHCNPLLKTHIIPVLAINMSFCLAIRLPFSGLMNYAKDSTPTVLKDL